MIRLPPAIAKLIEERGTIVVPTRQRAHATRLAHSAAQLRAGRRVWISADIITLEAWLTREVERRATSAGLTGSELPRLLSPVEEWLLWRQCTAEATGDWELVNRTSLAEALRRASALAAEYGIDVSRLETAGAESALLHEVQQSVDERCRSFGAASLSTLLRHLSDTGDERPVALCGFQQLTPRLEALARVRQDRGRQTISLPPDPDTAVRPRVLLLADEREELERIVLWCRQQLDRNSGSRLLVVLPGAPGARERLATLIRQTFDPGAWLTSMDCASNTTTDSLVVIEGGSPLAQVPAVAHALFTLAWLAGEAAEFNDFSEWLRAPYWTSPDPIGRARLDLWLRERGRMSVASRDLAGSLRTIPAALKGFARDFGYRIAFAAAQLGQGAGSPRLWSERFRAALTGAGWPGDRARTSADQQTVLRFHELLDEFGQLAAAARSVSRESAIRWFTELAARTAYRPADDDAAITISPMFADPIVRYDGVWVAGLHADRLPQPVQPDPYLPIDAQAKIPAAGATGRLAEARGLLAAWRSAADELVLSAPLRSEDLELLPSPLLAQWGVGAPKPEGSIWLPERLHREGWLETLEDAVGLEWPPGQALPGGTRSLDLQNQCPFRAYAELRLGSSELGAPEPGIAPERRGQLLHAALQLLWQDLRDWHGLNALAATKLDGLIHRCVEQAAHSLLLRASGHESRVQTHPDSQGDLFSRPGFPPELMRECRRAVRLIRSLCELERQRAPFTVAATELDTAATLAGAQVRMRIDRIDLLHEGGRAILDYKSGRRTAADWYGDRPSHPQLLAYLAAVGGDVAAMATVNVTAREVRFEGIGSTPSLLPKVKGIEAPEGVDAQSAWEWWQREWRARMERLAGDFVAGRSAVDPKAGACDYCHVTALCRIGDRERPDTDDSVEHDDE